MAVGRSDHCRSSNSAGATRERAWQHLALLPSRDPSGALAARSRSVAVGCAALGGPRVGRSAASRRHTGPWVGTVGGRSVGRYSTEGRPLARKNMFSCGCEVRLLMWHSTFPNLVRRWTSLSRDRRRGERARGARARGAVTPCRRGRSKVGRSVVRSTHTAGRRSVGRSVHQRTVRH